MEKETHTNTQQKSRQIHNASESCVDYFSVSNRVVVITGSNRGNGFAIATGLSNAGAKVVRIDLAFDNKLNTEDIEFDLTNQTKIWHSPNSLDTFHSAV